MQASVDVGQQQGEEESGKSMQLGQADDGSTVKLHVGDLVIIQLESNPSTGFIWVVKPGPGTPMFSLVSTEHLSANEGDFKQKPMVGQAGFTRLKFQIQAKGKAAVELVYKRPFEQDVEPAKSFRVDLEID